MRIDHYAYQRGTRVAGFGLMLQLVIGLTLLLFGRISGDTVFTFASIYVLAGSLVWISLIIIFHQHKLERLEALEEDELASSKTGGASIFEAHSDEQRVAARRLALMHRWLMPSVSLALAVFLGLLAWWQYRFMERVGDAAANGTDFLLTPHVGWVLAISLSFALLAFIFSRFVAGMAKLEAWQNLRGGAGYMVGSAIMLVMVAIGAAFRIFDNTDVISWIAQLVMPFYVGLVAAEIVLLFILNLYRPRIPGEVPRPAFDSRVLSLLAAPDSIVKSLNEAVDYQFGFDITSSWGYQLLLRSFVWLIAIGVAAAVLLNTMVVVEPHQQAVRLRFGEQIGEVHDAGIMWKWPWPIESAEIHDVGAIRVVNLTARREDRNRMVLWTEELRTRGELEPFIVGSTVAVDVVEAEFDFVFEDPDAETEENEGEAELPPIDLEPVQAAPLEEVDAATAAVSRAFALVDAEMSLHYRIRHTDHDGKSGLLKFLRFVPETPTRRAGVTTNMRDDAIRAIALREVTQYLATLPLDDVLSQSRGSITAELQGRIQLALDNRGAGVEVLAVNMPLVRPRGHDLASHFEEVGSSTHARREIVAKKQGEVTESLTRLVGDPTTAMRVLAELDELERMEREHGSQSPEAIEQRMLVERLLRRAGGEAARRIANAETDRWVDFMNKRVQATRTQSQILSYGASPELYMQREIMRMLSRYVGPMRKYVIGIDPSRINIDADLKELSPLIDFSTAMPGEGDSN